MGVITNNLYFMKKAFARILATFLIIVIFVPLTKTHAFTFSRPLNMQTRGEDVSQLQLLLSREGFFKGYISGNYGVLTVNGVRKLQEKLGLKPDGAVGPITLAVLNRNVLGAYADTEEKTDEASDDVSTERIGPGINLKPERILFLGGYDHRLSSQNQYKNDVYSSSNMENWSLVSPHGASNKWNPRWNHEVFYFSGKYWVIGGNDLSNLYDMWSSIDGITWNLVNNDLPFDGSHEFETAIFRNRIYVIGGYTYLGVTPGKVWSSADGVIWTIEQANTPFGARAGHTVAAYNDKLYVIGGFVMQSSGMLTEPYSDIWSSSDGINWIKETNNAPWGKIQHAEAVKFNQKLFLLGGDDRNSQAYDTVWSTNDGVNWIQVGNQFPAATWGFGAASSVVVAGKKIWAGDAVVSISQTQNRLWSSPDGVSWTESRAQLPWSPRSGYRLVSNEGALITLPHCSDGIDNDGDGLVDYPNDPGCASATDNDEYETSGGVCDVDNFYVPSGSINLSSPSIPLVWDTNGCTSLLVEVNSGYYTRRYRLSSMSGTMNLDVPTYPPGADDKIDLTLFASNGTKVTVVGNTVPVAGVSSSANQCTVSVSASYNQRSIDLQWASNPGCIVYIEKVDPGLNFSHIFNPGMYYYNSSGTTTVPNTGPAAYYITAQTWTNTGQTLSAGFAEIH